MTIADETNHTTQIDERHNASPLPESETQANTSSSLEAEIQSLQNQLTKIQKDYADLQEICKKAQNDYIMIKLDFDQYQNRIELAKKDQQIQTLIDVVKKFLPFID
jgi:molecular chaperone GrpE (heat shock protein)